MYGWGVATAAHHRGVQLLVKKEYRSINQPAAASQRQIINRPSKRKGKKKKKRKKRIGVQTSTSARETATPANCALCRDLAKRFIATLVLSRGRFYRLPQSHNGIDLYFYAFYLSFASGTVISGK
jgi:hypothetical protein